MVNRPDTRGQRLRRHRRVRGKISGTADCPRLNVFRSQKHIYAQIINDVLGVTLCAASSLDRALSLESGADKAAAAAVGKLIGEKAAKAGIKDVIFDRGGYLYHGRVQSLAEAAREAGLNF